jgi:hypothetical protein
MINNCSCAENPALNSLQSFTFFVPQITGKFNHKDAVEKLDSQMVSLQQNSVSFAAKSQSVERKKVEAIQTSPDVPVEDIEDMIECFENTAATSTKNDSKSVTKADEKTEK